MTRPPMSSLLKANGYTSNDTSRIGECLSDQACETTGINDVAKRLHAMHRVRRTLEFAVLRRIIGVSLHRIEPDMAQ